VSEVLQPLARAAAAAPQPEEQAAPQFQFYWYCMEEVHPGAPNYSQDPFSLSRIFGTDSDQGCPTCPACQRQVTAVAAGGPNMVPPSVIEFRNDWLSRQVANRGA